MLAGDVEQQVAAAGAVGDNDPTTSELLEAAREMLRQARGLAGEID